MEESGTVCWFSIAANDLKKSQAFYSELFGWQFESKGSNLIIINNKKPIGHLYECKERVNSEFGPLIYIAVKNVDKAIERAQKANGTIVKERTELPEEEGFYAHLKDLDGNIIGIWSY